MIHQEQISALVVIVPKSPRQFEPWRLFFPSALLLAPVNVLIWLAGRDGLITPPGPGFATWHGREMLFGYTFAVIAGYLLAPMSFPAILFLWLLWLAGRLLGLLPPLLMPPVLELMVAGGFPAVVAVLGVRRFSVMKRARNLPFPIIMTALGTLAVTTYAVELGLLPSPARQPTVLVTYVVAMLIMVMGGRLVPTATIGALRNRGWLTRIPVSPWQEGLIVAGMFVLVWSEIFDRPALAGVVALVIAAILALRMRNWHSIRVWHDPAVWPLHLGFVWLVIGSALIGLERLGFIQVPDAGALHALAAGGIGTITLVMMSRVTGYRASAPEISAGVLHTLQIIMALAVIIRISGGLVFPEERTVMLWLSAAAWAAAYGGSAAVLLPEALRPALPD
ncbi:MAG: NnrS family protein [Gammaproteobacteria bacterium]|nr:NnrS family protein [Gammaproteobacteria bacterium]